MKKVLIWTVMIAVMLSISVAFATEEYTYEDVSGFYDVVFEWEGEYEVDESISIILTPNGYGRVTNSTSSYTFDYHIEGNKVLTDNDELTLTIQDDGRIIYHLTYEGFSMDLPYLKRENVNAEETMVGKWKLRSMKQNTTYYSPDVLKLLDLTIEMTIYENGTVDWYAKSNSISNVAQGWGVDNLGLYLQNGEKRQRVSVEEDTLEMKMEAAGGTVTYTFSRMK